MRRPTLGWGQEVEDQLARSPVATERGELGLRSRRDTSSAATDEQETAARESAARAAAAREAALREAARVAADRPAGQETASAERKAVEERLAAAKADARPLTPAATGPIFYARGVESIETGQWRQAVELLLQAIAIDPVPQAGRRVDDSRTMDYFPQCFLFVAYLKLDDLANARRYYAERGRCRQRSPQTRRRITRSRSAPRRSANRESVMSTLSHMARGRVFASDGMPQ